MLGSEVSTDAFLSCRHGLPTSPCRTTCSCCMQPPWSSWTSPSLPLAMRAMRCSQQTRLQTAARATQTCASCWAWASRQLQLQTQLGSSTSNSSDSRLQPSQRCRQPQSTLPMRCGRLSLSLVASPFLLPLQQRSLMEQVCTLFYVAAGVHRLVCLN